MALNEKKAFEAWKAHCRTVQEQTTIEPDEPQSSKLSRINRALADYAFFTDYYFPHFAKVKTAAFQVVAANKIRQTPNLRGVFIWPRAHAKSTHMDIMIPLWLKAQKQRQLNVMVLVGKSQDNANTLLSDLQAELQYNRRYINDFGPQYNAGSWQEGQFVTSDGCAFFARGRGQSPRGLRYREQRPDYIVIDDLDDDELVENPARVEKLTLWVKEALFGALDGGRGRFVMVGNLLSKNSVLANIAATEGTFVSQVNIYDKKGHISWKEKWRPDEVKQLEQFMGYRSFQKEYMNNPIRHGAVFRSDWIRWAEPLPYSDYDMLAAYCDPSFRSGSKNDYKAIKMWGKTGTQLHHLEAFVRQCSITEMVRWLYDLHEKLPQGTICHYVMEANFIQDMILDEFATEGNQRGYQLPIRPDHRRKPDKFQRIEAISPLWERGYVHYNINRQADRDMLTGIDQLLSFEKGSSAHDDGPDADEGAIWLLQRHLRTHPFAPKMQKRLSSRNIW
jgi:predicted phage terminase large subunit-like protein